MPSDVTERVFRCRWPVRLAGGVLLLMSCVGPVSWGLWRWRTSPGFLQSSSWELGAVDTASRASQELRFVYEPGVRVPGHLFALEFQGLPTERLEREPQEFGIGLTFKDGGAIVGEMTLRGTGWCQWEKLNPGVICESPAGERIPIEVLVAGREYQVIFSMVDPVHLPEGVTTILHGYWWWRGTPDQVYR